MATTAQKTTMTTSPITTPGNLPTVWHVPKPLSGIKSRQKPVFKVESGSELSVPGKLIFPHLGDSKNNTETVVPVATPLSLTLDSRILAVGDAGRAVAKLLLQGAEGSSTAQGCPVITSMSPIIAGDAGGGGGSPLFLHQEMEVLHLGPHLILPNRSDEDSESPKMTEGQRARFLVSKALEKSRAQVVLVEKEFMLGQEEVASAEKKAVLEIWERTLKQVLLSEGLQTFKGAVVCCIGAKEEERLTSSLLRQFDRMAGGSEKKLASWNFEKWFAEDWMDWDFEAMDVVGGQEVRQDPIHRPKIELLTNAYESLVQPESPYFSLYEPVQKLFGTCFQDDFADFAQFSLAKPEKGWLLWLLIERKRKMKQRKGTKQTSVTRPRLRSSSEVSVRKEDPEPEQQPTTSMKEEEELVLLGFLIAKLHPKPRADLRIERVGVVETLRGQGFWDRLMEAALEYAKNIPQDKCKWVSLEAFDYVVPYYERLGFTDMSCLLGDSEEDDDEGTPVEEDGKVRLTLMEMKNISKVPPCEEEEPPEDSEEEEPKDSEEEPEDSEEDSGFFLPPPMKADSESTCSTKEEPEYSDEEED